MSVEPSVIIVAIVSAAGALLQGADIPPPVKSHAIETVRVIEHSAPAMDQQIRGLIARLPEPVQAPVQQAVADATETAQRAIEPHVPPGALEPPVPPAAPAQPVPPARPAAPQALTPAPAQPRPSAFPATPRHADAPPARAAAVEHDGAATVPSILPGLSLAPIGAIAVFAPWLRKAGSICDGITPPVLAALYSAENGFRYGPKAPVSPAGARGPGQFMPGTWDKYGKDADGDGKADVLGIADPVMASGHLLCDMYAQIEGWKRLGVVRGDTLDLTLAAYNAGIGAVRRSGGMPSGLPDYETQTKPYVARIRATEDIFARMLSPFLGLVDSGTGDRIVDLAFRYLGLPYVWGGGNINGPSGGGFDCSGLTSFAVYAATGVTLPRTSQTQWHVGREIALDQARPGDLLFGNWQADGPAHVAIYLGNGQMVHAPTFGDVVRVGPVFGDMRARRIW